MTLWICLGESIEDGRTQAGQFSVGLLPRSSRAQTQVDEIVHSLSLARARRTKRRPKISRSGSIRVWRKNTHHGVGLAFYGDRLSEHIFITVKRSLPELIAQHHSVWTMWPVFLFSKFPAD